MTSATPTPWPEPVVVPRRGDAGRWIAFGAAIMLMLAVGGHFALVPSLQPAAVVMPDDEIRHALQEAEAGRRKAEAETEKLRADAARRELEVATADKKRLEKAAARQQAEADAEARRKAEEQKKTAEDEAKARAIRLPSPAVEDVYGGSLTDSTKGHSAGVQIMAATLRLAGTTVSGQID